MGSWKSATVTSSETVLIRPESPTAAEKRHLALSNLDRLEMQIYTPVILLYEAPANSDFQTVVASLKDALRKALVEYYPFAGRLVKGDDGLDEVRCDDAGAFFTEVVVAEELAEIGGFEGCVMLSGMEAASLTSTGLHSLDDYEELPPLVIQPQEQVAVEASEEEEEKPCKKVEFTVSEEEIRQLKKQASGTFTSGVCISAHLWRLVTKARGLNRDETTTIFTIVDGRKRMKGFPVNYFGNCIFTRRADCTVWEVLDMPLGHLAQLIHDSIAGITEDYVRSVVDYIEVTGASNLAWSRPKIITHDLQPTFWRFFPIYELDFGFGRPTYGGRNSPLDGSTGFAAVSPTPSSSRDGSVLISVFLYPEAADDLAATLGLLKC